LIPDDIVFAPLSGSACLPESSQADRVIVGAAARRRKDERMDERTGERRALFFDTLSDEEI
jgi:hypothetical protein